MSHHPLLDAVVVASAEALPQSQKQMLLARASDMLAALQAVSSDASTPERVRAKLALFEESLRASQQRLQDRFFQPVFLLNAVGEAMGCSRLISKPVVTFLQVGLYFFGLDQIERRWPAQAVVYSGLHADHLAQYLSRDGLKALLLKAESRHQEARAFCLSWHYLNGLRRAYFDHCRVSGDALDHAQSGEVLESIEAVAVESDSAAERIEFLLGLFRRELTPEQRWIYLAKNRSALEALGAQDALSELLAEAGEAQPNAALGWVEISARLGINEKRAKREYLSALHTILLASAQRTYGVGAISNAYVRRILDALAASIREKDLRLKDHNTGRGMGVLVEKWQVALRFVLSHERVSA
ncbi:MAG: hypothetical protein EXS14_06885 [Planctomycetes bacterium]|nr:hypothetical protein [Planctomycetota bacterium]